MEESPLDYQDKDTTKYDHHKAIDDPCQILLKMCKYRFTVVYEAMTLGLNDVHLPFVEGKTVTPRNRASTLCHGACSRKCEPYTKMDEDSHVPDYSTIELWWNP